MLEQSRVGSLVRINRRASRGSRPGRALLAVLGLLLTALVCAGAAEATTPYEKYEAAVTTDSPTAQFRFDDLSGSTMVDDSVGSFSAVNTGIALGEAGPFIGSKSGALGGSAYATMPSAPLAGVSEFTAEGWVDWTGTANNEPIFSLSANASKYMTLTPSAAGITKTPLTFELHPESGTPLQLHAEKKLATKNWEYVAVTETSGGTVTLYLDGAEVAKATGVTLSPASLGLTLPAAYLGKGASIFTADLKGSLSNVAFYTKALSSERVLAHYGAGISPYPEAGAGPSFTGTAKVGNRLHGKEGKWGGAKSTFALQWLRCNAEGSGCTNIAGATGGEYEPTAGDIGHTIRLQVTATNSGGSEAAISEGHSLVVPGPINETPPAISGTAEDGQVLTSTTGVWVGETKPSGFAYQWERCSPTCAAISGATASSYRVTSESIGAKLRVTVTAESTMGNPTASSEQTATIVAGPPVETALPSVSGEATVGAELKAAHGTWAGTAPLTYAYEWERCSGTSCHAISGATGESYTLTSEDAGKTVRVKVTATNSVGSASAKSQRSELVVGGSGGAAVSWGENYWGELGQFYKSTFEGRPVGIQGLNQISEMAVGNTLNLALLSNGELFSWGGNNHASLGDETTNDNWAEGLNHVPVKVSGVTAVAAANQHPLALIGSGPTSTVDAWGPNQYGTLGNGRSGFELAGAPTKVGTLKGVKSIAAGGGSDYVLLESGEIEAWGSNTGGQLSPEGWPSVCDVRSNCTGAEHEEKYLCKTEVGNELCSNIPRFVVNGAGERLKGVVKVVAGFEDAYALLESGEVLSWGSNSVGALGQKVGGSVKVGLHSSFTPPGYVVTSGGEHLKNVTQISAGYDHVVALLAGGEIMTWGDDERGELGEGSHETCQASAEKYCFETARRLKGLEAAEEKHEVEQVAAGAKYTLALVNHEVYAWGKNGNGELATGSNSGPEPCTTLHTEAKYKGKAEADEAAIAKKIVEVEKGELTEKTVEQLEGQLKNQLKALKNQELQAEACSKKPLLVVNRGAETSEYSGEWGSGAPLEHVASIDAGNTHAVVTLEPGIRQPAPIVSLDSHEIAGKLTVGFKWSVGVSKVAFRLFEAGESGELGEAGSCEEENPEECVGTVSETGPPVNVTPPRVRHLNKNEELPDVYREGQMITVGTGIWEGAPITFSYQWQRCPLVGECVNVESTGADNNYELTAADVGFHVRAIVSATNSEGGPVEKISTATAPVRESEAKRKEAAQNEKVEGLSEIVLSALGETPFMETPYEFKLSLGAKTLRTAVTPTPEGLVE
jgi:alpha-tubulin suppressor-like RCC1 family protein